MPKIDITQDKCKGCLLCVEFCPKKILVKEETLNKKGVYSVKIINPDSCSGCGFCAIGCPDACIMVFK